MADVSVTAASVVKTDDTGVSQGIAGGTVTAGQPLYKDSTDSNKLKPAIATGVATSTVVGIALHGASTDQPLQYATRGNLTFNAAFTVGTTYVLSASAAGGIAPVTDLTSGNYPTTLGIATTTSNLKLGVNASGITI